MNILGADLTYTSDGTLYLFSNASTDKGLYTVKFVGSTAVLTAVNGTVNKSYPFASPPTGRWRRRSG